LVSGSGRSVVFVDHTAEYAVASDQAINWQGGWPVLVVGCMLVESLMRPVRVVVPRVLRQDRGGVAFVVDQDAVGALTVDGAHEPLGITVRSGSSRRCGGLPRVFRIDLIRVVRPPAADSGSRRELLVGFGSPAPSEDVWVL
jgi:hypothetical protein